MDGWPTELVRNQVFARRSSKILKSLRPDVDVVVVNGAITRGSADVNAVHMVHTAWLESPYHSSRGSITPGALYQRLYSFVNSKWERRAFHNARYMIAVSHLLGRQIGDLGIDDNKIVVIPNGVDVTEFTPRENPGDRTICSELGVPDTSLVAFFAGDIRRSLKNLDTVLKALVEFPDVHLLVAGDVTGSPYPAISTQLGIADRVHFLGYRRDLPALMQASDVFVFPSRYESFSLVLLEAMATGIPVITASTVGAASLVADAGIVIDDPEDLDGLIKAIRSLKDDAKLRQQMGSAGRSIAQGCTFKRMAEAYVDFFEKLVIEKSTA